MEKWAQWLQQMCASVVGPFYLFSPSTGPDASAASTTIITKLSRGLYRSLFCISDKTWKRMSGGSTSSSHAMHLAACWHACKACFMAPSHSHGHNHVRTNPMTITLFVPCRSRSYFTHLCPEHLFERPVQQWHTVWHMEAISLQTHHLFDLVII